MEILSSLLLFISKYIVYLIGFSLLLSGIVFLCGESLEYAIPIFIVALILTLSLTVWEFQHFHNLTVIRIILLLLITNTIIVASTVIAAKIYDKSWDGMAYHQIAVIKLEEGWNPAYESLPLESLKSEHLEEEVVLNQYVNHYPKAHEIFAAICVGVTDRLESGKVFNLLIIIAAFCSVFFLLQNFEKINSFWALAIALAATLNPIALSQLFSYYLDGAIGSLLVIFIVQLIMLFQNSENKKTEPFLLAIFFLIIILSNMKFTSLIYTILFCFLFITFLFIQKRLALVKKFSMVAIPSGLLAVGVVGFNPYIRNTLDFGHPLHPIAGKHKIDVISSHIPEQFLKWNQLERFIESTFSESANIDRHTKGKLINLKIPFTFKIKEIKALQGEGIRLGGFGVFWSGIFSIAIIFAGIGAYVLNGPKRWYMLMLLLAIALSVALNSEAWWARFVPQLWLFPVIVFSFLMSCEKLNVIRIAKGGIVLLIINSLLVASIAFSSAIKTTIRTKQEFAKWGKSEKPILVYFDMFTPNERKLKEKNIHFIKTSSLKALPCVTPGCLLRIDYCYQ